MLRSYTPDFWLVLILFALGILCQFIFIMQCGLTGLVLDYRHDRNPMIHSVIYGIALYNGVGIFLIAVALLWSLFDPAMHSMLIDGTFQSVDDIYKLLGLIVVGYTITIAASYFVNKHFIAQGVNVD